MHSPALTTFMKILSFGGTFFMVLLVFYFLYFLASKKVAFRYLIILFFAYGVTQLLKSTLASPRPFLDAGVLNLSGETFPAFDYSFPSGHSTIAMTTTMFLLLFMKRKWLFVLLVYPVLIALSRLYLGVHRIEDALVGLMIGFSITYLSYPLVKRLEFNPYHILASSVIFIGFLIYLSTKPHQHPLTIIIASSLALITLIQFFEQRFINFIPSQKLLFSLYQFIVVGAIILLYSFLTIPQSFITGDHFLFYFLLTALTTIFLGLIIPLICNYYEKYKKEQNAYEISNK